ncbi:MAG: N-6 DNA methylase [Bacteroidota bacterium]|nr:N-6 DNA methylase [Bacteroidota bacterium]
MGVSVSYTERAWGIDLIAHIKAIIGAGHMSIKEIGGEVGLIGASGRLFPDVILYGDRARTNFLQGWELKMPDTSIDNRKLVANAAQKADALQLNSFVLWNVTTASLYVRPHASRRYVLNHSWPALEHVTDRDGVQRNHHAWRGLADTMIVDLNDRFTHGSLKGRPFAESLKAGGVQGLILDNVEEVAEALKSEALRDAALRANMALWWDRYRREYKGQQGDQHGARALARANLYNWIGKIVFAHVLGGRDHRATGIVQLNKDTSPKEALKFFESLTANCNFWTVFSDSLGLSVIPNQAWSRLMEFSQLLATVHIGSIDQDQLSDILTASVAGVVQKVRGQYATPSTLANIMSQLALRNVLDDRVIDPCCGSGTIARAMIELKIGAGGNPHDAASRVYAGDFDPQAAQIATLAMVSPSLMDAPLRAYCDDVFALKPDSKMTFHNPSNGSQFIETLGKFDAIASNLPFVAQVGRKHYTAQIDTVNAAIAPEQRLSRRADVSAYIPLTLRPLLGKNGRMVVIITNAWLSTDWGDALYTLMWQYYRIKAVVTSGSERWFQNSKVVAHLLVLESANGAPQTEETEVLDEDNIDFIVLEQPLYNIAKSADGVSVISAAIELGSALPGRVSVRSVGREEVDKARTRGVGRNAQFVDCGWTESLSLVPLRNLCEIRRGMRRGCDRMFYPRDGHGIEPDYIHPVLKSPRNVLYRLAVPHQDAFCCSVALEDLEQAGHKGALEWIRNFEPPANQRGGGLPSRLARPNMFWYEMRPDTIAELVIPINPGARLFVARLHPAGFVDQRFVRLTGLTNVDMKVLHALLNSAISLFYLEGLGHGRGLGALDLSSDRVGGSMHVLDPRGLSREQANAILSAFKPLEIREICPIIDECDTGERQHFDETVIEVLDLHVSRDRVYRSLNRLVAIRLAARNRNMQGL